MSPTPERNSFPNARLPTIDETADSISGRAAIRSAARSSTTPSVILAATSVRELSSWSATVARLANWSESTSARRA
jgi:hypothetical protein